MVSFWPFGGDDNSAASFERVLSQLSAKINRATAQNDNFRLKQRKYKVLWTLYAVFTYILIDAILLLVTGWQQWGIIEYTVVAGGPPFIYSIRTALDTYYGWRVRSSQEHLNELNKQREVAIGKLKQATKYDSTQQLLDKYGGSAKGKPRQPSSEAPSAKPPRSSSLQNRQSWAGPQASRTGMAPPPTANIPSKQSPAAPQAAAPRSPPRPMSMMALQGSPSGEDFAPNAFDKPQRPPMPTQPSQYATAERRWYDRVLDVMLGEDEGQAKNRTALICESCKLVNGQAPPGARTLEDIGRWRCGSCHAWNGVESEEKKILKRITGGADRSGSPASPTSPVKSSDDGYEHMGNGH